MIAPFDPVALCENEAALIARRDDLMSRICARLVLDPATGCWLWTGPTSGDGRGGGYPRMSLDGRTVSVHRVMGMMFAGFVHPGRQFDHTCRVRRCCNPGHLQLVTNLENQRRRAAAGGGTS